MNAHTPFDANQDWSNPYCRNSSNDPMVDALLGNAYHVVRTVYCNLGYIKHLYDFLSKYGVVICVQSEAELKTLTTEAKYARIYDKSLAGDRRVTDYLYVDDDRTGILPDDTTAIGSWVKVATSNSGVDSKDGGYIPWVYNSGSANGGETSIRIPDETAGAPFMIVNGDWQTEGYDFEYDPLTFEIKFTTPLEQGDFVVVMRTGVPATPDNPNVSDWVTINWLYNHGAAVGGEQVIDIPYTFQSVPAVYKNGLRFCKGLSNNSYTVDSDNNRIILTEPLATNDRLVIQLGGEAKILETVDHTIQEVARATNVKDSEVILSTDTTQVLNGKKVIYDVVSQRIYGLPTLPTNVYINAVADGQLTYSPGNITVTLLDSYQQQNTRELWRRSLVEAGLTLVDGSFEEGATANSATDAVWHIAGGQCYTWGGEFPKIALYGSTPESAGGVGLGAWLSVGDAALRQELVSPGGLALVGPGVITRGLDKFSVLQGRSGEQFGTDYTRGLGVHLAEPITGSGLTVNTAKFNYIRIDDDRFNAVDDLIPGTKVDGFLLNHKFGGPGTKGGRHAAEFILEQLGQTDATNTDRNYVGVTGFATSSTGDGGVSLAGAKGAYFGGNFYGTLTPGAMYTLNVTGAEFNVGIPEGASSNIRTGLQIGGTKAKRGDVIDAAISVGNMGGACTWRTGIAFGPQNGGAVFGEDSRVLSVDCPKIDRVLSLGSLVEVNHIIFHNLVKLSTKSLQLEDSGAFTSVGSPTIASTVQTIYRSSGAGSAFDARVVVSGGSATDGQGNYEIKAGIVTYNCTQRPSADNQFDYGSASYRGRTAYFGTGAINTSDDNHKPIKEAIPDVVLDAWEEVSWRTRFKFDDAVAQKGEDGARWHFGLIAQRVEEVFASHGIDGFGLGLLCYDEWEDQYISVRTNEGERVTKTRTVSRMMEVTKTRTVKRPVMMTATREILVDEEAEDGERIKRVVQEEYQTPKLIQVFVFNEDGSPRLDEAGKQLFVYEAELEDVEEEYTEQVPTEVIEEYTEPAEPTYSQVLETPAGSRYGIRYEEALALEAALQRRNYERMKEQYENLVARVEDLESK